MSEELKKSAPEGDDRGFPRDKDAADGRKGKRRRKVSYLTLNKIEKVDYKDVNVLRRFTNERGKITAARQNGNTAKQQRMIAEAIDRARELALMPFVAKDMTDRREPRRDRGDRYERHDRDRDRDRDRGERPAEKPAAAAEAAAPTENA
ncbi:MAG: 30S ribosomal protein S18 [Armatimonadetes bacterium]|nr:30S ribosomal protein S18 [Armatimonadota bacterium]